MAKARTTYLAAGILLAIIAVIVFFMIAGLGGQTSAAGDALNRGGGIESSSSTGTVATQ